MKHLIIFSSIALCLLLSGVIQGQGTQNQNSFIQKRNIVDITTGGNGLVASVNYSRLFILNKKWFMNISAGIGTTVPLIGGFTLPHQLTLNYGEKSNLLEIGIGGSYWQGKSDASAFEENLYSYNLSPVIGWRKHWENNFVLRVYVNPIIHVSGEYYIENYSIIPYAGISFGYAF